MAGKRLRSGIVILFATVILSGCVGRSTPAGKTVTDVAVVTQTTGPVNHNATVVFGVEFSTPIGGFTDPDADVQLVHSGTAGGQVNILAIDGQTFAVTVTGVTGDGSFQLSVPEGAAFDGDGNGNAAGLSSAVLVDNTPPQIAEINSQGTDGRFPAGTQVDVTVSFTEPVTLSGGTLAIALNTGHTVEFQPFANSARASTVWTVQAGDNADPLDSMAVAMTGSAQVTDAAGNVGQIVLPAATLGVTRKIIVDTTAPIVTVKKLSTNSLAKLTGTVNDPTATVIVTVAGTPYSATNNGDGTWSLAGLVGAVPLLDGTYDVTVTATDAVGNTGTDTVKNAMTIDSTPPLVIVTRQTTYDHTPTLTGAVDDATAAITVTVAGKTYTAANNRNGTWTLDGSEISPPLVDGVYDVAVEATDPAGNVGHDTTTNELTITS